MRPGDLLPWPHCFACLYLGLLSTRAAAAWTPPAPPAVIPAWAAWATASRRTPRTGSLSHRHRRAFYAVKVRLGVLVELLSLFTLEVFPTLDQDGALIGGWLALVKLMTRLGLGDGRL